MNNDYLEGMTMQQRNITSIYEPQNPLYHKEKDAYFYPLTSEKQIVMDDGRRLNAVLEEDFAKKDEVNSAKVEAIDSSKVYTDEQIRKAAPRNLLDNSDFRNPVNQRGLTAIGGVTGQYLIDRWKLGNQNGTATLGNGYITVAGSSSDAAWFQQKVPHSELFIGKTFTLATKDTDNRLFILTFEYAMNGTFRNRWPDLMQLYVQCQPTGMLVSIVPNNGVSKDFLWAVLYEGEYTEETLPEYQPKGYGAELAECQRYCVLIPHTVEGFIIGYGLASTNTTAYITVDLPATLQDYTNLKPTIMGRFQMRGNGVIFENVGVTCFSYNGHKLVIECNVSSGLAEMQFYALRSLDENVLISREL